MKTAKSQAGAPQEKRARVVTATVNYPYHPLELCLELAKAVREIGNGRAEVTKSQLAHRLGVSEQSSDYALKIASAKSYGMVDGRTTLQLTDISRQYFFPTEEGEEVKKRCLLSFLGTPGLLKELINLYDGSRPPAVHIISNLIGEKYGIPESWKMRVSTHFIRSAQYVGVMGSDGFLRFKAQMDGLAIGNATADSAGGTPPAELSQKPLTPAVPPAPNKQNQEEVTIWSHGMSLRVETPVNMTKEIWEKLNKYIQAIEP